MTRLDQPMMEKLIQYTVPDQAQFCVIYFTAKWCGPCNNMLLDKIVMSNNNLNWYLCDIDENDYTAGYCGVRTVPSFMGIVCGKPTRVLSNSNQTEIIRWLQSLTDVPKK